MRKSETVLLPALTATSWLWSSASAPWPPDGTPLPPVRTLPAGVSVPFPARSKTATALPYAVPVSV